jgi:hypothetical protein
MTTPFRFRLRAAVAAGALLAGGCGGSEPTAPPGPSGDARLRITALVVGTPIDLMVATVTASDIAVPLVFNLPVSGGLATGTLRIPPGPARTIGLEAFDELGSVTHEGSATVDVQAGTNPPVSIAMLPRSGDVPVTATLAEFSVIVTPASAAVPAGETLQFTAEILDPDDNPLAGTVTWAVTNPAFARIDAGGLATGVAPGALTVVATFGGVAGVAQLTVTDGVTGTVQGTVSSPEFGPLAGVLVTVGVRSGNTGAGGTYVISGVPEGPVSVSVSGLPASCADPGPQGAQVVAGQVTVVNFAVTCTEPGSIIFNEIMPDPTSVADANGEWIELYNGTSQAIDLSGWVITNDFGEQCTLTGQVGAGGYFVAARNTDPLQNGGVFGATACNVQLSNSTSFALVLLTPGGSVVDLVGFGSSTAGRAWNLDPDSRTAGDNDSLANWCLSLVLYNSIDTGTPGTANHACQ